MRGATDGWPARSTGARYSITPVLDLPSFDGLAIVQPGMCRSGLTGGKVVK